jgi:hypothetical protein
VSAGNAVECDYREAGSGNGALATFGGSTNGLVEYTANNFGGAMLGNLLAASFTNTIYRIQLSPDGTSATVSSLFSSVGNVPLDIDALGPAEPFPGTIWVGDHVTNQVIVFEPNDFASGPPPCTGADNPNLDEDLDGFDNADEIDNGTNPCSAADVPPDSDEDFTSELNDPDDDNDGSPDVSDPFALDPSNGATTPLPVEYLWENDGSTPGGILNLGFTGLMTNGLSNYANLFDPAKMTAGGAAGVLTVDQVSEGDAFGALNSQEYGLQFGLDADPATTDPFFVHTRILAPFSGLTPQTGQSMGLFVGTGHQDDYAKIVVSGASGGQILFLTETAGVVGPESTALLALPGPNYIDLYLRVDPDRATVQPFYSVTSGGVTGPQVMLALPHPVPANWFTNSTFGLAVGIISTSQGPAPVFPATWDFIRAVPATTPPTLGVSPSTLEFGTVTTGQTQSLSLQLTGVGSAETADVVLGSPTLGGTNANQFTHNFGSTPNARLAPGESTTRTMTFAPTSAGSKTATLDINHSGSNTPVSVPLSGAGTTPQVPTLGVSPGSLSFGSVTMGQTAGLNLQLTNQGTSDLVVDATTISGSAAAQFSDNFNDATNVTLVPGASTTVVVTFAPTSTGDKTATLSIAHTGGNTPVTVPLSGTATTLPTLGVSPGSLSFGSVTVGQTAGLNLQLTNQGTTNLVVDATTISGSAAAQFSDNFNDAANVTLVPGASTTVVVTFAPASTGNKTATLSIAHTGGNTPVSVSLSGTGSTASGPQVTHFSLINADTDLPISGFDMLTGGPIVLDLATLPTRNLNLRAHTLPEPTGSVRFGLDGVVTFRVESTAPYALAGDTSGNYTPWTLGVGPHTVTATPFTAANANGTAGQPLTLTMTIVDGISNSYRVNAGGPAATGTPTWSADTSSAPSPYVNAAATGNLTFTTSSAINMTHPSLPSGTPAVLFQSERFDQAGGVDMQWSFPVTAGSYEVRLYFAEIFFTTPGQRVFDVSVEGNLVLNDYDIVADVGALKGVMKSFIVTSDAILNVDFGRVTENPKVSAVEIIPVPAGGGGP